VNGLYRHGFLLAPSLARRLRRSFWRTAISRRCRVKILVNGAWRDTGAADLATA